MVFRSALHQKSGDEAVFRIGQAVAKVKSQRVEVETDRSRDLTPARRGRRPETEF